MIYRKDNNIYRVTSEDIGTQEQKDAMAAHHSKGYMGVDKIGRPVYIELCGRMSPTKLLAVVDEPTLVRGFIFQYEEVIKK